MNKVTNISGTSSAAAVILVFRFLSLDFNVKRWLSALNPAQWLPF
jgi:hypothetical protein